MPEDKKGFYDGTRIANPDTAYELANVEATQGQDARIAREEVLKKQHETGLTEKQRYNLRLMDELERKYPDAFSHFTDTKGRLGMAMRVEDPAFQEIVISQEGMANVVFHSQAIAADVDWTNVLDFLGEGEECAEVPVNVFPGKPKLPEGYNGRASVRSVDLSKTDEESKRFFRDSFKRASELSGLKRSRAKQVAEDNKFDENRLKMALSGF